MDDDQMQLLDARRAARRHSYEMVDAVASLCSSVSGEERRDRAGIMPRPKSTQHVLRPAGGRDAEHDVASVGQATDLPGKDLGIAVVIGDRGHRRCVSIESDRGKRLALAASPPEKLGGKMAGLGRAAAVAERDDLITASERLDGSRRPLVLLDLSQIANGDETLYPIARHDRDRAQVQWQDEVADERADARAARRGTEVGAHELADANRSHRGNDSLLLQAGGCRIEEEVSDDPEPDPVKSSSQRKAEQVVLGARGEEKESGEQNKTAGHDLTATGGDRGRPDPVATVAPDRRP